MLYFLVNCINWPPGVEAAGAEAAGAVGAGLHVFFASVNGVLSWPLEIGIRKEIFYRQSEIPKRAIVPGRCLLGTQLISACGCVHVLVWLSVTIAARHGTHALD